MMERLKAIGMAIVGKSLTPEEAFLRGLPIDGYSAGGFSVKTANENSAIAYACIRRLAVDAGNAPYLLLTDPKEPESTIDEAHPIAQLFRQPNPWYNSNQFFEHLYTLLNLRGEFFIVPDSMRQPTELIQFFDPLYWNEQVNEAHRLVGWEYNHMTVAFKEVPSEVVHHRLTNIKNPFRGQTPLLAAATALWTEIDGDTLAANIMSRGGEKSLVYTTEEKLLGTQEEELRAALRARRVGRAKVAEDALLTGGMTILDPKFTGFDYQLFDRMGPAEQKIIQVYGLSPSLIGRDDEPNYATFMGRLRIYWRQTLLPMMTAVENTLDGFLKPHGLYFRYDRANIPGLQEDLKEQAQIAMILNKSGIPWAVINERLQLGLDPAEIPGSDDVMVQGSMVPLSNLIEEYENPPEEPPAENPPAVPSQDEADEAEAENEDEEAPDQGKQYPSFDVVLARSKDISTLIARNRKLAGLERAVASSWRALCLKYKKQAVREIEKAVAENHTPEQAAVQFQARFSDRMHQDFSEENVSNIMPRSTQAIGEGEVSIEQLVKRLSDVEIKEFSKQPEELLSPRSLEYIAARENLVKGMGPNLFQRMMADLMALVTDEGELGELAGSVRNSFNVAVNRAVTIARTEIGTAFNVGRFNNMQEQGYGHHEWVTDIDEFTRESHEASDGEIRKVGDLFPCGLAYPQEPGGPAEEVIGCRCLTLPLTQEQADERTG